MSFERIYDKLDELTERVGESLVEQAKVSTTLANHIKMHCDLKKVETELKSTESKTIAELKTHITTVKFVSKWVIAPILTTLLIGVTKLLFF